MSDTRTSERPGRGHWAAAIVVGLGMAGLAALFAFLLLYEDRPAEGVSGVDGVWAFVFGTLAGHAAGGFVAGALLSFLFGRNGLLGWLLALVGGAVATLLAGAVGGALATAPSALGSGSGGAGIGEAIGIAAGALVVPMAAANAPFLILLWLALIGAIHAIAGTSRQG